MTTREWIVENQILSFIILILVVAGIVLLIKNWSKLFGTTEAPKTEPDVVTDTNTVILEPTPRPVGRAGMATITTSVGGPSMAGAGARVSSGGRTH